MLKGDIFFLNINLIEARLFVLFIGVQIFRVPCYTHRHLVNIQIALMEKQAEGPVGICDSRFKIANSFGV